jgi:hypothetical protein
MGEDDDGAESATGPLEGFRTARDIYGVSREYSFGRPSITPDLHHTISKISDSPYQSLDPSQPLSSLS